MSSAKPALPFRNDTILGVCEALGEDLHIPANLFRVAFASLFYFSPLLVTATYFGLGALVFVSRWVFPSQSADVAQPAVANEAQEQPADLPLAA